MFSPAEMGWIEKEIEQPPPPKLTGLELWGKTRKIAQDRAGKENSYYAS